MSFIERSGVFAAAARTVLGIVLCGVVTGCATASMPPTTNFTNAPGGKPQAGDVPQSTAAQISGNTYIPIDPLAVTETKPAGCKREGNTLSVLPDNDVRVAITDISGDGGISVLGNSVGVGGRSYRIVVDYINVDSSSQRMVMERYLMDASGNRSPIPLFQRPPETTYVEINRFSEEADGGGGRFTEFVNIPVYIGVGIRITVNLTVKRGEVELAGLGSIAAAAKLQEVSGDLVIQTLGITGNKVATALPLPSELTPESIQNAIMAMATIKSALYSTAGDVIITPRVVGFYDPLGFGQQQYVNAVVAELASKPIVWNSAC